MLEPGACRRERKPGFPRVLLPEHSLETVTHARSKTNINVQVPGVTLVSVNSTDREKRKQKTSPSWAFCFILLSQLLPVTGQALPWGSWDGFTLRIAV